MFHKRKNNKDLEKVLRNLRSEDREELEMIYGPDWFKPVFDGWKKLKGARVAYTDDNTPICIFGVYTHGEVGFIGMLATQDIEKEQRSFLIQGKKWVEAHAKKHKVLMNYIYSKNKKAIKWLEWLGFSVEKHYGLGDSFLKFYKGELNV
jgi:hypothetical protein